jgi:hypothetical protein
MTAQEFKVLVLKEIEGAIADHGSKPDDPQFQIYWQGGIDALSSLLVDLSNGN